MLEILLHSTTLLVLFFVAIFLFQKVAAKKMSEALLKALKAPVFAFIAVFFLSWGLKLLQSKWNFEIQSFTITTFRNCAFLGVFCWAYTRVKNFYLKAILEKVSDKRDFVYKETVEVASNVFSVLIYVATFFALLQISGVNIAPFITFGGLGLAVFGIAGKDFMSNFFAGVSLKITNPFKEGEFVEIPDKKVSGVVQKMGFFTTRLIDDKCRPILVPNVIFSSTSLINGSRQTHFVFSETFDVGNLSLPEALSLEEKISQLLRTFPGIDQSKNFQISTIISSQKSIKIEITVYFARKKNQSYMSAKNTLMQSIFKLISLN